MQSTAVLLDTSLPSILAQEAPGTLIVTEAHLIPRYLKPEHAKDPNKTAVMLSWTLVTEFDDKKLQLVVSTRQMQVPLEPPQTIVEVSRVFYYQLVCTVASLDTQYIDSNLESGRYISRVGRARARGFLSRFWWNKYQYPYMIHACHGSAQIIAEDEQHICTSMLAAATTSEAHIC